MTEVTEGRNFFTLCGVYSSEALAKLAVDHLKAEDPVRQIEGPEWNGEKWVFASEGSYYTFETMDYVIDTTRMVDL